ncbi:MAG TPA: hypothetical protein VN019_01195 [Oxalicibacterium sp.]|nr:hypothetical protein [Oxalicibacterium sp.]
MQLLCGAVMLAGGWQTAHAQVASFDCARAATPTEKTVCATPSLGAKDVRVASYYEVLQDIPPAVSGMVFREFRGYQRRQQAVWLKTVRDACGDRVDRLLALKDVMAKNLGLTYGRMCDGN